MILFLKHQKIEPGKFVGEHVQICLVVDRSKVTDAFFVVEAADDVAAAEIRETLGFSGQISQLLNIFKGAPDWNT